MATNSQFNGLVELFNFALKEIGLDSFESEIYQNNNLSLGISIGLRLTIPELNLMLGPEEVFGRYLDPIIFEKVRHSPVVISALAELKGQVNEATEKCAELSKEIDRLRHYESYYRGAFRIATKEHLPEGAEL